MNRWSVRTRLMVWNVFAVAALTVLLGFAVSWRVRAVLTANVDRDLRDRAMRRVGFFPGPPPEMPGQEMGAPGSPAPIAPPQPGQPGRGPDAPPGQFRHGPNENGPFGHGPGQGLHLAQGPFRPRVFDDKFQSVSQFPQDLPWDRNALKQALQGEAILTTVRAEGEAQRVFTIRLQDPGPPRIIQYAYPLSETDRAIAGVNHTLFGMLPFALFIAGLGGFYLTDRALRPVKLLASGAEKVSGENLAQRLPVQGQDEFAQLAGTINSMLDRVEQAFRRQAESIEKEKRFTGDASHELRSPLTAIKANTSLALASDRGAAEYKQTLVEIDKSATRMAELIDDLLILARADAVPLSAQSAPVELRQAVAEASPQVPALHLAPDAQVVSGNRAAIVRLLANLLSNAFRHSPQEGSVSVRSTKEGNRIRIEVADQGEGVAPDHLPHLGERFYRVDSARARSAGGVGLGLAICQSIVHAHGGELRFASELGKGTTVSFTLPAP